MELKLKRILAITLAGTMLLTGCNNSVTESADTVEYLSGTFVDDLPAFDTSLATKDTDGDGYTDLIEDVAGTDKNVKDNFTSDNALSLVQEVGNCKLELVGTPNIYGVLATEVDVSSMNNKSLLLSPVYEFSIDDFKSDVFSAVVSIEFDDSGLTVEEKENVCIYQYMPDGSLSKVDNCTIEGNVVTATLPHFSRYTVSFGDVLTREEYNRIAVCMAIDNSGSMYEIIDEEHDLVWDKEHGCANDPNGLRWDFAREFIDAAAASENTKVVTQMAVFSGEKHQILHINFDTPLEDAHKAIDDVKNFDIIKNVEEDYFDGTAIGTTTSLACNSLRDYKAAAKYVIILTDGCDTTWSSTKYKQALSDNPLITPILVGLGDGVDEAYLKDIASYNNGHYIHLGDSSALEVLNSILGSIVYGSETIYFTSDDARMVNVTGLTATDNGNGTKTYSDGNTTYNNVISAEVEVLADSGFRSELHSLPFDNFRGISGGVTGNGYCFGLCELIQALYTGNFSIGDNYTGTKIPNSGCFKSISNGVQCRPLTQEMLSLDFSDYRNFPLADIANMSNDIHANWASHYTNGYLIYDPATKSLKIDDASYGAYNKYYASYGGIYVEDTSGIGIKVDYNGKKCDVDSVEVPVPVIDKIIDKLFSGTVTDDAEYKSLILLYYGWLNYCSQKVGAVYDESGLVQYYCLDSTISQTDDFGKMLINGITNANTDTIVPYAFFDAVVQELRSGVPAHLGFKLAGGGGHSVTCQRLLRSLDDATVYYLEIYDNNTHNETYYMRIDLGFVKNGGSVLGVPVSQDANIYSDIYAVESITFRGSNISLLNAAISRPSDKFYSDVIVHDDGAIEYVD